MRRFRALLLVTASTLAPGVVFAQSTPSAPASPQGQRPATSAPAQSGSAARAPGAGTTVQEVVVQGRASEVRSSIDSTSYNIANDLQAATGTLADALRNVPSVEVDPQGNVSLRGDSNVTILVDGRPSGILSGEGRAAALLQLSADQYSRIEVMTNPSAAYRPDGSGGVINLITKPHVTRPGSTYNGSVRVNAGNDDRYNFGTSGAYTRDRLTLSGDLGLRHDRGRQETDRARDNFDTAGALVSTTTQDSDAEGISDSAYVRLGAEYRLSGKTQLAGELRSNSISNDGHGDDLFATVNALGGTTNAFERISDGSFSGRFWGATARVVHTYAPGHEWSNELRYDRGRNGYDQLALNDFSVPAIPDSYQAISTSNRFEQYNFASAYTRPMAHEGKLRAGYELEFIEQSFNNASLQGASPTSLVVDPTLTNLFTADQAVHALYATYERAFGKLTAQFGLRVEYASIDLDQITSATTASNDYTRAYPTLHLGYQISETEQIRGSYSRRIQRPGPFDLNPFRVFQDPLNYRSGNPALEPQVTDSYELMWQRRQGQTFYQATLYLRDTSKAFTSVVTDIGGGVLLTRPENLGSSRSTGVELVANGRLLPTLRYNASANVFRQEIDASTLGVGVGSDRTGTTVSGRLNVNWQPNDKDFLQVGGFWTGDSLLAQGRREGGGMINVGYRHKLNDKLAFQLTVRDLFDNFGDTVIYETPRFIDRTERLFGGRMAFIGLTYTFGQGGQRRPDPGFDFSGAPSGQ